MSKLVKIAELVEDYGKSESSILTSAHIYRKNNGSFPDWFIKGKSGSVLIDIELLNRQSKLDMKAWELNTDSTFGLYWVLRLKLGYNDQHIAKYCAWKSKKFNSLPSWKTFMQYNMFNIPSDSKYEKSLSMNQEFLRIASRWIYLHIKAGAISRNAEF